MRMMVFDRKTCTWRPWNGTRAAWLKLPHAVATAVCVASTAVLPSATPLPAHPVERVSSLTAPPPPIAAPGSAAQTQAAQFPGAAFLPAPWFLLSTPIGATNGGGTSPPSLIADGGGSPPSLQVATSTGLMSPTPVPEPNPLALVGWAVLVLAAVRRRHFFRRRPPTH